MTPKQKARQLIETYSVLSIYNTKIFDNILASEIRSHIKISALIAVDELIEHCNYANKWYWQEVKKEIQNL